MEEGIILFSNLITKKLLIIRRWYVIKEAAHILFLAIN